MIANDRKAKILKCVADGGTLKEAGARASISAGRARQLLAHLCRELKLPFSVGDIRAEPKKYLTRLDEFERRPQFELRKALVHDLIIKLKLKTEADLTPGYVSNISASQLLSNGITLLAVTEIQEWLSKKGLSLRRRPPKTDKEITEVKRAIALLDVFHFDTVIIKEQLQHLEGGDD
jgi:hypothetical protein